MLMRGARPHSTRKLLWLGAFIGCFASAVAVVVLVVSTEFAATGRTAGEIVTASAAQAEYAQAQRLLRLPPGYTWPPMTFPYANSVTSLGAGGEDAVLVSQTAWDCYRSNAIRDRDREASSEAHAVIDDLLAHHFVLEPTGAPEGWRPSIAPPFPWAGTFRQGYDWMVANEEEATRGDISGLASSCRANSSPQWHWPIEAS
jgi:hypothetical protein